MQVIQMCTHSKFGPLTNSQAGLISCLGNEKKKEEEYGRRWPLIGSCNMHVTNDRLD